MKKKYKTINKSLKEWKQTFIIELLSFKAIKG